MKNLPYCPPENIPSGSVIIFEHSASVCHYAPSLDLYRIDDNRFLDLSYYTDLKIFMELFNENFEKALQSHKSVFTVGYNALMARVIKICLEKYFSDMLDLWHTITFFHDDGTTEKIMLPGGRNALIDKMFLLEDMLHFPYIKKIEIPYKALITAPYLADLLVNDV
jgi:hypothetical protein